MILGLAGKQEPERKRHTEYPLTHWLATGHGKARTISGIYCMTAGTTKDWRNTVMIVCSIIMRLQQVYPAIDAHCCEDSSGTMCRP